MFLNILHSKIFNILFKIFSFSHILFMIENTLIKLLKSLSPEEIKKFRYKKELYHN